MRDSSCDLKRNFLGLCLPALRLYTALYGMCIPPKFFPNPCFLVIYIVFTLMWMEQFVVFIIPVIQMFFLFADCASPRHLDFHSRMRSLSLMPCARHYMSVRNQTVNTAIHSGCSYSAQFDTSHSNIRNVSVFGDCHYRMKHDNVAAPRTASDTIKIFKEQASANERYHQPDRVFDVDSVFAKENETRVKEMLIKYKSSKLPRWAQKVPHAAVLVPLCHVHGEPSILLTLRSADLVLHRGQVRWISYTELLMRVKCVLQITQPTTI